MIRDWFSETYWMQQGVLQTYSTTHAWNVGRLKELEVAGC